MCVASAFGGNPKGPAGGGSGCRCSGQTVCVSWSGVRWSFRRCVGMFARIPPLAEIRFVEVEGGQHCEAVQWNVTRAKSKKTIPRHSGKRREQGHASLPAHERSGQLRRSSPRSAGGSSSTNGEEQLNGKHRFVLPEKLPAKTGGADRVIASAAESGSANNQHPAVNSPVFGWEVELLRV